MGLPSESSWPYTNVATTDTEFSWLMRELGQGVTRSDGATTLQGSANSSGMFSFVEAGRAIVRGYMYRNSTQVQLTHDAADTSPRIDTVVIELDVAAVDPADRAVLAIVKGTAAGSPVAPSLTQTDTGVYQFPLYDAYIAGSATNIAAGNITDRRVWRDPGVGRWSTATRPPTPYPNQTGFNTTTSKWETYDGSSWVDFDAGTVGGRAIFDGTNDPSAGLGADDDLYIKWQ